MIDISFTVLYTIFFFTLPVYRFHDPFIREKLMPKFVKRLFNYINEYARLCF